MRIRTKKSTMPPEYYSLPVPVWQKYRRQLTYTRRRQWRRWLRTFTKWTEERKKEKKATKLHARTKQAQSLGTGVWRIDHFELSSAVKAFLSRIHSRVRARLHRTDCGVVWYEFTLDLTVSLLARGTRIADPRLLLIRVEPSK